MIKTYNDDSNQLCDFYDEGESFEGLFDFCQGYCDNCNDHPNCMYRQNLRLKNKLKIAVDAIKDIQKILPDVINYSDNKDYKFEIIGAKTFKALTQIGKVEC